MLHVKSSQLIMPSVLAWFSYHTSLAPNVKLAALTGVAATAAVAREYKSAAQVGQGTGRLETRKGMHIVLDKPHLVNAGDADGGR